MTRRTTDDLARALASNPKWNPIKPIVGAAKAVKHAATDLAHDVNNIGAPGQHGKPQRDLSTADKRAAWTEADRIARKNRLPRSNP